VPPRDGDRFSSDGEDGLVAQIIPLRQRERDPDEQPSPGTQARDVAADDLPPSLGDMPPRGERSVWDQPTAELRRRRTETGSTQSLGSRVDGAGTLALRFSWRLLAVAATVALGAVVFALVVSSAYRGRSGSAMRQTASSALRASSTAKGRSATANHSPARRSRQAQTAADNPRQQQPGTRGVHRHHQQSPPLAAHGTASESALADSSTGVPVAPRAVESSPPPSQGTDPAPAQTRCVPGELGC
jgi:hypothetical protein